MKTKPSKAPAAASAAAEAPEWEGPGGGVAAPGLPPAEVRDLDAPELAALEELFSRFGPRVMPGLLSRWTFKVFARTDIMPHRRVFAVARARVADLLPFSPIFLGVPVAHLSRQGARLTLEGGGLVAPLAERRTVSVAEKGETLFLYGRDLLSSSLRKVRGPTPAGEDVLVLAESDGRYLGIGTALAGLRADTRGKEKGTAAVRNRLDLGLYLRAQQEIPE